MSRIVLMVSGTKTLTTMKKTFKFFAAALAIVAAASCAKENATNDGRDEAPVEMVEVSFTATIDSPSDPTTKTTLADDGLSVHWTEGDKILLYKSNQSYNYSNSRSELSAESISENFTTFSGTAVSSNTYDAVYPSSVADLKSWNSGHNFLVTNTLSTQTLVAKNFSKTSWGVSNIAMAVGAANGEILKFNNMLAHFKFSVSGSGVTTLVISASSLPDWYSGTMSGGVDLGGTLIYRFSDRKIYANSDVPITVTNNGNEFVAGETYYVAVPATIMTNLTFTFKDASGNELGSFTKSSFTSVANTIYNLGTLNVEAAPEPTPQDELTVSATNITIPAAGGSQTFTITTNNDWTITSTQDWITVSPTSGSAGTHTITLSAEANTTGYNRNRAYIDVKAGSLSKSVTADQSMLTVVYSRGEQVSGADAMEDGAYYVILRKGSSNDYLAANNSGQLIVSGISDVNNISKANIFVYHKDDSKKVTSATSYGQTSGGTLQSLYNSGYIDKDMKLSNTAQDVTLGSHWGVTDPNIDIYRAVYTQNIGAFDYYQFISYVNSSISWKKGEEVSSSDLRKWYFYKVNAVSE